MSLENKTIILGISGGIAAYKACDVIRGLKKEGADVHVILTKAGEQFITPLTLQTLSCNPVYTDMFNLIDEAKVQHVSLADKADLVLVAPATADIIAKMACGICDELLTTVICATKAPVVFAPSMNVNMWEHPITQDNIKKLKKIEYYIIEPEEGDLACDYEGKGRLASPDKIVEIARDIIK